jgi:hypothetical protein
MSLLRVGLVNDLESRIKRGRKAITLAKEKGIDTTLWEKELARLEALAQAEEVARRTEELIHKQGWCLWKCQALNGDYILVVDDFAEPGDYPAGYPVYTMSEITVLFGSDKPASKWTLMMVHEAKKLAGAEVTDRTTKTEEPGGMAHSIV